MTKSSQQQQSRGPLFIHFHTTSLKHPGCSLELYKSGENKTLALMMAPSVSATVSLTMSGNGRENASASRCLKA